MIPLVLAAVIVCQAGSTCIVTAPELNPTEKAMQDFRLEQERSACARACQRRGPGSDPELDQARRTMRGIEDKLKPKLGPDDADKLWSMADSNIRSDPNSQLSN